MIPDDETPIHTQLKKEYAAAEQHALFFGVQITFSDLEQRKPHDD